MSINPDLTGRYKLSATMVGSLFPSDTAVLSNDDIEKILASKIALPEKGKLAILKLSGPYSNWNQSISPGLEAEVLAQFCEAIVTNKRIAAASLLPNMLVPEKPTVPLLREAAARYQSDLLLVYRTSSGSFSAYHAFSPDVSKVYCTVEAVLLDVRTGVVPFTSLATDEFEAKKTKDDVTFSETTAKAEQEAINRALLKVAVDLTKFLDAIQ